MRLESDYPELFNFFGAYFPDSCPERSNDDKVVADFALHEAPELRREVIVQGRALLGQGELPSDEISTEANRRFESEDDMRRWLGRILMILEAVDSR